MASSPSARLFLPRPALGDCLFAGVMRDTRALTLTDGQRFNYYPAAPMPVISWIFEGMAHQVEADGALSPPLPCLSITGGRRPPTVSWAPGPIYAVIMAFYPEALSRLLGIEAGKLPTRTQPLENVASGAFLSACQAVSADPGRDPFRRIEEMLEPLWTGPRPDKARTTTLMTGWVRSHLVRAAMSKPGRGLRQLQRQIKSWTGHSNRELQLFARTEQAFLSGLEARAGGVMDLADVAATAGYADQSHMSREIRRVTGFSPAQLEAKIASEEPFWLYRLVADQFGGW